MEPDVEEPAVPTSVETSVSAPSIAAGSEVLVTCTVLDQNGAPMLFEEAPRFSILVAPDDVLVASGAGAYEGRRVGTAAVTCSVASLSLVDETPSEVQVTPGAVVTSEAVASSDDAVAGEAFSVTCVGYDAFDNLVSDVPFALVTDPFGTDVTIEGLDVTITRTGFYAVACDAPGVSVYKRDLVEILPALPAAISVAVVPARDLYAVNEVVTLSAVVTDRYGNVIPDATVEFSSEPSIPSFGTGRYRFDEEGVFLLGATVPVPTETGEPLFASAQVIVNGEGPTIDCVFPADGDMLTLTPGDPVLFEAGVSDTFAVDNVLINGVDATLTETGTFEATVTTRRGINFVEVSGRDAFGEENVTTCAFLVSDRYTPNDSYLNGSVGLRLAQDAFDDNNRADGLDSINDIFFAILNNEVAGTGRLGVEQLIDSTLGANPVLYDQCIQDVCVFGACACILRARVEYRGIDLGTPNNTALTLVDGGLRLSANLARITINLRITGTVSSSGTATITGTSLSTIFNLTLGGDGRPQISVRPGTTTVNVGAVDTNFSGIAGAIVNVVVDLFRGPISGLIGNVLRDFVNNNLNGVLDGLVSSLDLDALAIPIDLPRLDGTGNVSLGFRLRFSAINATPVRALFGIGTQITSTPVRINNTGALLNPDPILLDTGTRSVSAAIHLGLLNQIFYNLWLTGFFDANLGGVLGGAGVPGGADATLALNLPVVVLGRDGGGIALHLGAARLGVGIPGVIDTPIAVKIGAVLHADVSIVDDVNIEFGDLEVVEFHLATIDASISPETRATLEGFIQRVLTAVLEDALNSALPSLPVPSFALPDTLATFGLPAGASLGLTEPILQLTPTHFVVQGNFGIR